MDASALVTVGIPAVAAVVALLFLLAVRKAAPDRLLFATVGVVGWCVLWGGLARAGVMARFDARPPPMVLLFVGVLAVGLGVGRSRLGQAIAQAVPLWALVAAQAFRLPLELVMHQAVREGVMPPQMSYTGYNFDIVTGATAILVAWALHRGASRTLALAWNVMGLVLLTIIAGVGLAATPVVHAFGAHDLNTFVAYFPFVYLPAVCVAGALMGHVIIFRALRS